jgi:HTH-type transcriptional regulator, cell division transcriptional repressor
MKMSIEKNNKQSERLKFLRSLTGLSIKEFSLLSKISQSTLSKCEAGIYNLSPSLAKKLIKTCFDNNIKCTIDWLMYGAGETAKTLDLPKESNNNFHNLEVLSLTKEIELLHETYKNLEILAITDDSMLPQFNIGDYVCGKSIDLNYILKYLDFACIVETKDGKKRLRRIGYNSGKYFLFGTNTNFKGSSLFELEPEITKVSPIFWHRITSIPYYA